MWDTVWHADWTTAMHAARLERFMGKKKVEDIQSFSPATKKSVVRVYFTSRISVGFTNNVKPNPA